RPAGRPVLLAEGCFSSSAACSLALVDDVLQTLASAEGRDLRGLDLDGGASLRVAALAGGALANFEAAETGEVDTATALQLLRDEAISREEEINDLAGLRL